jgi:transcription initiation factor TFIIIB Brf1 subunit/transcription initiation factor TFIIB
MTQQKAAVKTAPKKLVKCPNCGSKRLSQYSKKTVCSNCGFVLDHSTINKSRKPIRQSSFQANHENPTAHLGFGENNSKKWQKLLRASDATERNLAVVLYEVTKIGQSMSVPENTLKLALEVYRTIISANLTKRKPAKVLAATIVYIACRQTGIAQSLKEIAYLSKIGPQKIRRTYNSLSKKMNLINKFTASDLHVRKLAISLFQQEKTVEIAEKIVCCTKNEKFCQGKNPVGLAASSCYIASILTGEAKTQREIAEASRVTEATVRNGYKQFVQNNLFKISL